MHGRLKVAHLLVSGDIGGVETLNLNAAEYSKNENIYFFIWKKGIIFDEMTARGYQCKFIGTSVVNQISDCIKLALIIRNEKIDVLICHFNNPFIAMCTTCVRCLSKKTKIVGYVHSSPDDWSKKTKICANIIFHHASRIICISDAVLNAVKKILGFEKKLIRIYNGVNLSKFRENVERNIEIPAKKSPPEEVYSKKGGLKIESVKLIYVGRLEQVKGIQNILRSLACVKNIPYQLKIVGDGSYRTELEQLTVSLGLSDNVEFLGNRRDIPNLLWDSDVFVHLPDWQEGFGITVIEAMAAGTICIVNNRGALPEIVTDGVDGYIISEGKRSFNDTICEIYNGLTLKEEVKNMIRIRNNAKRRAEDFSIEKYVDAVDTLILKMT